MSAAAGGRSIEEAAAFFKVRPATLRSWIARGCPVLEQGGQGKSYELDLRAIHVWRKGQAEQEAARREAQAERDEQLRFELFGEDRLDEPEELRRLSPAERQAWHRSELARVQLGELRADLVIAADARRDLARVRALVAERLEDLWAELADAAGLAPAQAEELRAGIADILADFHESLAAVLPEPAAADDGPPALPFDTTANQELRP